MERTASRIFPYFNPNSFEMKYVLTIVSREILTAEEEGLGTTGTRKGVNQQPGKKTEVS